MIEIQQDDAKRRVQWIAKGDVTLAEILDATDRQAAGRAWTYSLLYDARQQVGSMTSSELLAVADRVRDHSRRLGPRGRAAIVVEPDDYGKSRMYAVVGAVMEGENQVFRDLEQALRWLDESP